MALGVGMPNTGNVFKVFSTNLVNTRMFFTPKKGGVNMPLIQTVHPKNSPMAEDKLKDYRKADARSSDRFYSWLETNCHKATTHEEVRKITSDIKKPIREIIEKQA
jgi:hypothetical protein